MPGLKTKEPDGLGGSLNRDEELLKSKCWLATYCGFRFSSSKFDSLPLAHDLGVA